jgi:UDP-2,4-diacetamido-2,4,6-trideoxy-beta-L-altropyranose hydrolase
MRVLIRCDASLAIGSGHVVRCRSLGRALSRRGAEVWFVCREQPGDLIASLAEEFSVLRLPSLPPLEPLPEAPSGRALYAAWLGCTQRRDAKDTLAALPAAGPDPLDWIVVDHYGLDRVWERRLSEDLGASQDPPPRVLVFDDLADRAHHADVLVDGNRLDPAATALYRPLVPSGCRLLLGPDHAPIDPLYARLQPLAPPRTSLRRVLVFYGGVDLANHTALALEVLSHPALAHLAVDVVLGKASPHYACVERLVEQRPFTTLHGGLASLAALVLRADLALGAAGSASWERAALALPTLVTPVADNQRQGAKALCAAGAALLAVLQEAGDPRDMLLQALLGLQSQAQLLHRMSEAARSLGDGRGLGRLLLTMAGPASGRTLRPAVLADEVLYHRWANDLEVRRQSFRSDPIPLEQHRHWFRARLQSSQALLRVLIDSEGCPLGQIRLERNAVDPARAVIGFSLDPLARGHGLAAELLQLGLAELARRWGADALAYGEVLQANVASAKAFLRAGFAEGAAPRPGVRCFSRSARATP